MSITSNLADYRYLSKRNAATSALGQLCAMGRIRKKRPPREPMTELHALFVRRVREEMKARGLNPHQLEEYGVKQRTLADTLRGTDPRLSTIYETARALGMKAADLLREGQDKRISGVIPLHGPQPRMIPESSAATGKAGDRKKRTR
jgi:hypothetical protein